MHMHTEVNARTFSVCVCVPIRPMGQKGQQAIFSVNGKVFSFMKGQVWTTLNSGHDYTRKGGKVHTTITSF